MPLDANDAALNAAFTTFTAAFQAWKAASETNPPPTEPPPSEATGGEITNFTSAPKSHFLIGGHDFGVHTAGRNYSLTNPDRYTLRFEVHQGDHAWYDGSGVDRAQVEMSERVPSGTPVNIAYQFLLEAGSPNAAEWLVTSELHNDDEAANAATSPPVAIELSGDALRVIVRHCPKGQDPSNAAGNVTHLELWTGSPLARGQFHDIAVKALATGQNSDYLQVSLNGAQVVDYHGPVGYGWPIYFEQGLYRETQPANQAAQFSHLTIAIG
jgi:hypothetical protein